MTEPRIITEAEHGINHARLQTQAIEVVHVLNHAGFSGELVGGCVRDLLLGMNPKDFDVSTNATPEQIKSLFRRCYIIGRRFRLAEVKMGAETVQVATYRSTPGTSVRFGGKRNISAKGKILKDNNFGDVAQDAFRRDLTINALYLRPSEMSIVDYTGGFDDIQEGIVRVIGTPEQRYREDPVRMLRTVRFAAALDFQIEPNSAQPITSLCSLLGDVSNSRLGDEIKKLFFNGSASSTFDLLYEFGMFTAMFPAFTQSRRFAMNESALRWLNMIFQETDKRVLTGEPLSAAYTMAAILWLPYQRAINYQKRGTKNRQPDSMKLTRDILLLQNRSTFIPKPHFYQIQEIWDFQKRMENEKPGSRSIVESRSFRAAVRLFELRARYGEVSQELCRKWKEIRSKLPDERRHYARPRRRNRPVARYR